MNIKEISKIIENIVPGDDTNLSEIYFEPLSMSGLEEMHQYSIDKRLYEFFEFKPFETIGETENYINKLLNRMSNSSGEKNAMYWFVRRKIDNKLIGTANFVNINYSRKSLEWGYGIDPKLWGKGYILKIQECLKKYVFETLNYNRLHGVTMITNERTISSILSCGMKKEGILRDYYFKNGNYIDGWTYSMIKSDYLEESIEKEKKDIQFNKNQIIEFISTVITEEKIDIDSDMDNTYSWDSMTHLFLLTKISEETGLVFSAGEIANANSVKSIISMIQKRSN
ncbi:GNAT family N-acetyltransferase [Flavobacteriaceae bacterium]|nr:GNAT family N-acetyltransferase [Flavobacteriaceae bacterium]